MFVCEHIDDPRILHEFINTQLEQFARVWKPLFFVAYESNKIVGIAPMRIRQFLGVTIASFVLKPSSGFVVQESCRGRFIGSILDLLFQTLKCKVVNLTFPTNTSDLRVLKGICSVRGIRFVEEEHTGCRVLPIRGKWEEFEGLRGSNFRNRFRKIENKLKKAGVYEVTCLDCQEKSDVFDRVLEIDKASWKERWRTQRGIQTDQELVAAWNASKLAARKTCGPKSRAWILELNRRPIAFAYVIQSGKTATIFKTSYDLRYKDFYPGMFIIHSAIRDLFHEKGINNIDFMTDMPFMEAWTSHCQGRKEITLGNGLVIKGLLSFYSNKRMRKMMGILLETFLGKTITRALMISAGFVR